MSGDDPKVIMRFDDRVSAETAASRLRAEGIDAHVWADDAGGALPQFGASRGVKLMVAAADAERATALLAPGESGVAEDFSGESEDMDEV